MFIESKVPNRLANEKSPYLLQHAYNPVDWYPWGEEAFEKAKQEDKPVFLSIGYSTCHWCHVMEKESFEDEETAKVLNRQFVCVKVDKEERPDIDSVYMKYCQAFTGNGGWPMTAFLFPTDKKPFFAGTYFPKHTRGRHVGLIELTEVVKDKWQSERKSLQESADTITEILKKSEKQKAVFGTPDMKLVDRAFWHFSDTFDREYGGFGSAPKFPAPHNLLFLLNYYEVNGSFHALEMAEKTLSQMYRGGIFDHVGYGFSRYSTDNRWLAPHFEKMLYDNALLILAYVRAYELTNNHFYKAVAEKTIKYVFREMTDIGGGFYSAQDADIDAEEGKFYLFSYKEIFDILGKTEGEKIARFYGATKQGNFEKDKNIFNLIENPLFETEDMQMKKQLEKLYDYRKNRHRLHKDDKILLSWNCLMIVALSSAARVFKDKTYLAAAQRANEFLMSDMIKGKTLFVSYRRDGVMQQGFLDDYAFFIFAQLSLYDATLEKKYLDKALEVLKQTNEKFLDSSGGYLLYGKDSESLVLMPKDTYDGAIPSGNSVMAYNLLRLSRLTEESFIEQACEKQIAFMFSSSKEFAGGYTFFMSTLLMYLNEPKKIICVLKDLKDKDELLSVNNFNTTITLIEEETKDYPLKEGKTTYYICKDHSCLPPANSLNSLLIRKKK